MIRTWFLLLLTVVAFEAYCQIDQQLWISGSDERLPEFPGGESALFRYLSSNIHYPDSAMAHGIEGIVYISFVITEDGRVTEPRVLKGVGGGCDDEALRVVASMPAWAPGMKNGETVRVQYNLPIRFSLPRDRQPMSSDTKRQLEDGCWLTATRRSRQLVTNDLPPNIAMTLADHSLGDQFDLPCPDGEGKQLVKLLAMENSKQIKVHYIFFLEDSVVTKQVIDSLRLFIIERIEGGEEFEGLAARYSMDNNKTGDLQWSRTDALVEPFGEIVEQHAKGDVFLVDIPEKRWYYVVRKDESDREVLIHTIGY